MLKEFSNMGLFVCYTVFMNYLLKLWMLGSVNMFMSCLVFNMMFLLSGGMLLMVFYFYMSFYIMFMLKSKWGWFLNLILSKFMMKMIGIFCSFVMWNMGLILSVVGGFFKFLKMVR